MTLHCAVVATSRARAQGYVITSCLVKNVCECMKLLRRLAPLSMLVSWEARALTPTRQLSLVTLLVTHSRTLQAHPSTFSSSSWLLSLWCLPHSSRLTPARASSSSTSMLEFRLWRICANGQLPIPNWKSRFLARLELVLCALLLSTGLSGVRMGARCQLHRILSRTLSDAAE